MLYCSSAAYTCWYDTWYWILLYEAVVSSIQNQKLCYKIVLPTQKSDGRGMTPKFFFCDCCSDGCLWMLFTGVVGDCTVPILLVSVRYWTLSCIDYDGAGNGYVVTINPNFLKQYHWILLSRPLPLQYSMIAPRNLFLVRWTNDR